MTHLRSGSFPILVGDPRLGEKAYAREASARWPLGGGFFVRVYLEVRLMCFRVTVS